MSSLPQPAKPHINNVTLAGVIAKDPTVKFTNTGKKLASTSLCVATTAKTKTFIRIVAWEEMADVLEQRRQGNFIETTGRIQSRTWDAPDGKKSITEVVVNNISFYTDETKNIKMEAGDNADSLF